MLYYFIKLQSVHGLEFQVQFFETITVRLVIDIYLLNKNK